MEEIDLRELIDMFLQKKILIILVVVIFSLMGAIYTLKLITPLYESSTSLVLVQTNAASDDTLNSESITANDLTLNSKLVEDYREIAKSKTVVNTVINNLGLHEKIEEIQGSISVNSISDTELIKISVVNKDPEEAALIANEVAEVFMNKVNDLYKVSNVHVLDKAEVPIEPSNINLSKNIVIFAFVGLILVSGYIILINTLDTTVKTDVDIERNLGVPVLASIMLSGDAIKKKQGSFNKSSGKNDSYHHSNVSSTPKTVVGRSKSTLNKDIKDIKLEKKKTVKTTDENVSLFSYVNESLNTSTDSLNKKKGVKK